MGVNDKMFKSIKATYENVQCNVRMNGQHTDWFNVSTGLKQGCLLSPLIFNLYINVLSQALNATGFGVDIDGRNVISLLYNHDLALVTETEDDQQRMLDILLKWIEGNKMHAHLDKSKIMHFRNKETNRLFNFDNEHIEVVSSYQYLGIVLDEYLNFQSTAKYFTHSATRVLGLVISKFKMGKLPHKVFRKLYATIV